MRDWYQFFTARNLRNVKFKVIHVRANFVTIMANAASFSRNNLAYSLRFLEVIIIVNYVLCCLVAYEPRREKTGFLHMRKQRRKSASR